MPGIQGNKNVCSICPFYLTFSDFFIVRSHPYYCLWIQMFCFAGWLQHCDSSTWSAWLEWYSFFLTCGPTTSGLKFVVSYFVPVDLACTIRDFTSTQCNSWTSKSCIIYHYGYKIIFKSSFHCREQCNNKNDIDRGGTVCVCIGNIN